MRSKFGALALGVAFAISGFQAAAALPVGPRIESREYSRITIPFASGSTQTIVQTAKYEIIDWYKFSISAGEAVQFNNGSGATLNRVEGPDISRIDGVLSATGSVYLINPSGVIIGKTGQINVGGTFVASTLDISNDDFNKSNIVFTQEPNWTGRAVVNLGTITAVSGDVVLMAATVKNTGSISAPNGDIGLLAGSSVLIRDMATDEGKFVVRMGVAGSSVSNSGALSAAIVELRANNGNVYALAGNTTGVINATGVSVNEGKVFLVADDGHVLAHGVITATGADGIGGRIVASGITASVTDAQTTAADLVIRHAR